MDQVTVIPRRLHRVWINPPGPPMPEEFEGYGRKWRSLHPDWQVMDWESVDTLVPMFNQTLYDAPPKDHFHRCRADVVRLELLWRFGGVYVDTDIEPVRSLTPLLIMLASANATAFIVWSANRWKGRRLVSNAVIGAAPSHSFIFKAITELPISVEQNKGRFLALQTVHYLTDLLGPIDEYGMTQEGVMVLGEETFFPQSIPQRRQGDRPRITAQTYAVHHWANSRKHDK